MTEDPAEFWMSGIQSKTIRHVKQWENTARDENNQSTERDPKLPEWAEAILRGITTVSHMVEN